MTTFYVYWDRPTRRVLIHRPECSACKNGLGVHGPEIATRRGETHDWIPCHSYQEASERARSKAEDIGAVERDCSRCQPGK